MIVGPVSTAVDVARAALIEAGRPDLAVSVKENRGGWPTMAHLDRDSPVIVKAFWLGHVAVHPTARVIQLDGSPAIECPVCEESWT